MLSSILLAGSFLAIVEALPGFRGANYIRLSGPVSNSAGPSSRSTSRQNATNGGYHSTFSPLFYTQTRAQHVAALKEMSANGFNIARVFLDKGDGVRTDSVGGHPSTDVLSSSYMDNVADFVRIARGAGIKIMTTFELLPNNQYFDAFYSTALPDVNGTNTFLLHPGAVKAKAEYIAQFIKYAKARLTPSEMETLAVYSIENEACYFGIDLPFSSTTLQQVTTGNGLTYNMSNSASRQQCADANAVYWADSAFAAVFQGQPSALATVGMFTFQAVGKQGPNGLMPEGPDPRFPLRPSSLSIYSTASFLDVHIYPMGSASWTLAADLQTSEWGKVDFERTPVMMGEFGVFKSQFPFLPNASQVLVDLQAASCPFNFSAWLVWTWDSDDVEEQPELWSAVDGNSTTKGGIINHALSPLHRPNPCKT